MKTENFVLLKGGIVRIWASKTVTMIGLATDGAGRESIFPTIGFYNNVDVSGFKVGDRVTIKAHIQMRRITDENGKVAAYHQDIIGDSISKTPRILADYLDGELKELDGGCQKDENLTLHFGIVRHIFSPQEGFAILSLSIPSGRGVRMPNYCDIVCFKRQADAALLLAEGDCVATAGVIRTRKNNNGSRTTFQQNIVCKDICKVDSFEDVSDNLSLIQKAEEASDDEE